MLGMSKGSRAPKWQRDLAKWKRDNPNRHLTPFMRVMADSMIFGTGIMQVSYARKVEPIIPRHFFLANKGFKHLSRKEREKRARDPQVIRWSDMATRIEPLPLPDDVRITKAMQERINRMIEKEFYGGFTD
jgi:hypothetical protein